MATNDYTGYIWTTWTDGTASSTSWGGPLHGDAYSAQVWTTWVEEATYTGTCSATTSSDSRTYNLDSTWIQWVTNIVSDNYQLENETPKPNRTVTERFTAQRIREINELARQERIENERQASIRRKAYKELDRKRKAAERTAQLLLEELIGPEQMRIYKETGRVLVHGRKHDYILQKTGFVKKIEKDKLVDLCIHLENKTKYPETDNVIALKMMIEGDETEFNKLANRHGSSEYRELPPAACM